MNTGYEWINPVITGMASHLFQTARSLAIANPAASLFMLSMSIMIFPKLSIWIMMLCMVIFASAHF